MVELDFIRGLATRQYHDVFSIYILGCPAFIRWVEHSVFESYPHLLKTFAASKAHLCKYEKVQLGDINRERKLYGVEGFMLLTPSINGLHGETFTTYPLMQTSWPTDPDFKSLNKQSSLKFWNRGHMQNGSDKLLENSLVFRMLIAQPRHPITSLGLVLKVSIKSGNGRS